MIYLILTASLTNHSSSTFMEDRIKRYDTAIRETLCHIPSTVYPVLVENTYHGKGVSPFIGRFEHAGKQVDVIHTTHGNVTMRNKGVNEWLDIRHVMDHYCMKDEDIIIKLTGRYRLLSPRFLEEIHRTKDEKDVWFRFMNAYTEKEDLYDCILGCYAARVSSLSLLSWSWINVFDSPEKAMAKYIRMFVPSKRIQEMPHLDVECIFSEDGRVLCV